MSKLPQHLEDKLLDYLDGKLESSQRQSFEAMIATDVELKNRLAELTSADNLLRQMKAGTPSRNFTASVMGNLDRYTQQKPSIRNGLFLLSGILFVLAIAVTLLMTGVFDGATTVDLNQLNLVQDFVKENLPSISIDGKWVINSIILLNLAVAFVVLDRAVLKPFFQRRMQTGH
jgi:anti-sigma factor RsiW